MTTPAFSDVYREKCLLLTTFTTDGKPKVDPVEAVARVLPKSETRRVYGAVVKRYWWHARWFVPHSLVRGGIDKVQIGLEITAAP